MESFYKPISAQNEGGIEALQTARKLKEERKQNTLKNIDSVNPTISKEARRIAIDEGWIEDNPDTISNTANGLDDMRKAVASTTATEKPYQETGGDPSQIKNNILKKGELGYNEQKNSTNVGTDSYNKRLESKGYEIDDAGNMYKWRKGSDGKSYKDLYATSDNFTGQDKADQYNKDMAKPGLGADQKAYDAQTKADTAADDMISSKLSNPSTDVKSLREKIASIPKAQAEADKAKKAVTDLGSQYGDTAERAAIESRQQQDTKDAQGIAAEKAQRAISEALNIDDVYRRAFNEVGTAQQAYSKGMDFLEKNGASAETLKNYQRKFERQNLVGERGAYVNPNEDQGNVDKSKNKRDKPVVSTFTGIDGKSTNYESHQSFQKDFADGVRSKSAWDYFVHNFAVSQGFPGTQKEKEMMGYFGKKSPEDLSIIFAPYLSTVTPEHAKDSIAAPSLREYTEEMKQAAAKSGKSVEVYADEMEKNKASKKSRADAYQRGLKEWESAPQNKWSLGDDNEQRRIEFFKANGYPLTLEP